MQNNPGDQQRMANGEAMIGLGIEFAVGELVASTTVNNKNQSFYIKKIKAFNNTETRTK